MPKSAEVRDILHWVVAGGDDGDHRFPTGVAKRGWQPRPVTEADEVLEALANATPRCQVGLIDLRGCDRIGERGFGRILPALACGGVGWVAGIAAGQLRVDRIRRLVLDHCHDYVVLPCHDELLAMVLGHAYGMAGLGDCGGAGQPVAPRPEGMIGDSPAMQVLYRRLQRAAMTDAPVYISGETGTGKELAASAIHRHSSRHAGPLVVINCGAIPESLVQSELFGFERGAFTGASQRKLGRIELAHGGTLFLDEIGDLPRESQASLLRFLEQGTLQRLGGHDDIATDARIICATHVDLVAAVAAGRFREDLYHRLRVIELDMPPLRERGSDIALLAGWALVRHAREGGGRTRGFTRDALRALHDHAWPGNVRELVNRVRQAVVMAEGPRISARDLRLDTEALAPITLSEARCEGERMAIERALLRNGHHLQAAACDLAISRVTLYRLMTRHGLRGSRLGVAGTG